jgi:hypothetical protein
MALRTRQTRQKANRHLVICLKITHHMGIFLLELEPGGKF